MNKGAHLFRLDHRQLNRMDKPASQCLMRIKNARGGDQLPFGVELFRGLRCSLRNDACVQLQIIVEAHGVFGHS